MDRAAAFKATPRVLATGEGRILIGFTVAELAEIARSTASHELLERVLTAIGLLDPELERELRA